MVTVEYEIREGGGILDPQLAGLICLRLCRLILLTLCFFLGLINVGIFRGLASL